MRQGKVALAGVCWAAVVISEAVGELRVGKIMKNRVDAPVPLGATKSTKERMPKLKRSGRASFKKRRREKKVTQHEDMPNARGGKKRENFATDLNSPTEPKGFPNGLTAEEKEWIMQDGLRMFFGDEELARGNLRDEQIVGNMWRRMAWKKFGRIWFVLREADESILYYEHPQLNYDKWYLRLRDRETVVQDNGMYEITTITEYGHEADEYRASKKLPAGATECEWAGRKYKLHNYSPPFEHVGLEEDFFRNTPEMPVGRGGSGLEHDV